MMTAPGRTLGVVKALGEEPIVSAGDRVRISMRFPVGHYRVPHYVRGRSAVARCISHPSDAGARGVEVMTAAGLITISSGLSAAETMNRLIAEVKATGMTVFDRIDHAAGAREAGLTLRPTELLIFGQAKGGTPLMQAAQTMGIDLPLKALVWQDEAGKTWLSYNDPVWLAQRHGIDGALEPAVCLIAAALEAIMKKAVSESEGEAS